MPFDIIITRKKRLVAAAGIYVVAKCV